MFVSRPSAIVKQKFARYDVEMCGRYVLRGVALLRASFEASEEFRRAMEEFSEHGRSMPRYNIAPSQRIPIVRINSDGKRIIDDAEWGVYPVMDKGQTKTEAD